MLSDTEKTAADQGDEARVVEVFGYSLAPCPLLGRCLHDAEWGHPCDRDENGDRLEACERRWAQAPEDRD